MFHLFRRESQKKRRESLVQRRKRKARLSISFLIFDFIPASFLVSYKLSTLIRDYRLLFDSWKFSFLSIEKKDRRVTRPKEASPRFLFFCRRFKGQEEGRIESIGLYAFFTRNQEPRPCPGIGLTGDAHGYSYENVCPVVSYRVVSCRVPACVWTVPVICIRTSINLLFGTGKRFTYLKISHAYASISEIDFPCMYVIRHNYSYYYFAE